MALDGVVSSAFSPSVSLPTGLERAARAASLARAPAGYPGLGAAGPAGLSSAPVDCPIRLVTGAARARRRGSPGWTPSRWPPTWCRARPSGLML